jgi:hypothetical protein
MYMQDTGQTRRVSSCLVRLSKPKPSTRYNTMNTLNALCYNAITLRKLLQNRKLNPVNRMRQSTTKQLSQFNVKLFFLL